MDSADNMLRLAIGVFYEASTLASAIAELQTDGVDAGDMSLAGTRQAIDTLDGRGSATTSSMGNPQTLAQQLGNIELVATDGRLLRTLLDHTRAAEASGSAAHNWLLPDLLGGLTEHLRAGAVALLVGAPDLGWQRRGSRILLRHTAHAVQTHEFTARRLS